MAAVPEAVPTIEIVLGSNIWQSDFLFRGTARGRGQTSVSGHH